MIRFKKDDNSVYPLLSEKKLYDILIERNTKQCITDDAPLLSFTIEQGVIEPSEKKTNKRDFLTKDMENKKYSLIEYNDIIYNPSNVIHGAIGRNKLRKGVVSPIYAIFKTSENPEYVELLVSNKRFINRTLKYLEGTVVKLRSLKPDDFLKIKVHIPCLEEQKKIADFISSVDEVIQESEKEVQSLEELKKGAMQKIFSQEVRFKDDDRNEYPEWEEKKIGELTTLYTGKSFTGDIDDEGHYVVMDMGSVSSDGFRIETKKTNLNRDILQKGDLVMPKDDIGGGLIICKTAYIPTNDKYVLGDHVFRLRISNENSLFIHYLINNELINRQLKIKVTGSAQLGIKSGNVANQKLLIPCFEEQQKIADFLSDFDTAIEEAKKELNGWKQFKKGLLQQMFM